MSVAMERKRHKLMTTARHRRFSELLLRGVASVVHLNMGSMFTTPHPHLLILLYPRIDGHLNAGS